MTFEKMAEAVAVDLRARMGQVVEAMAEDMRSSLEAGGHIDTGNLINSIHSGTTQDGDTITGYVDIDAESAEGTWYAEFLEFGTGVHNENGDGRQTPWRYKDRHGEWHTTSGMQADPFIRPAVAAHIGDLDRAVSESLDLRRYKR